MAGAKWGSGWGIVVVGAVVVVVWGVVGGSCQIKALLGAEKNGTCRAAAA